jgi:hypothetical protein
MFRGTNTEIKRNAVGEIIRPTAFSMFERLMNV